mmetsp:Transcript_74253/g.221568  ORF Transcript_74253/g.221568 Transcript_74253/m.221568 type:complete len:133 (-) Transcript_74253:506-904(-)
MRERAMAFVRMLGSLHKVGIVRGASLRQCMEHLLLISRDEQKMMCPPKAWIECACELLKTVGKDLRRTTQGKCLLRMTMDRLDWIKARARIYPPRIRFLIEELLEACSLNFPSSTVDSKGGLAGARCRAPLG